MLSAPPSLKVTKLLLIGALALDAVALQPQTGGLSLWDQSASQNLLLTSQQNGRNDDEEFVQLDAQSLASSEQQVE